jgi:hypothetical protein
MAPQKKLKIINEQLYNHVGMGFKVNRCCNDDQSQPT